MYADHQGWPLERVQVEVRHSKVSPPNAPPDSKERTDLFERDLRLTGALDAEQRAKLIAIAGKCPVHRTLEGAVEIRTAERP
jgi:putative redox protein